MIANVDLEAQGSGSELNIPNLTRFAASGSSVNDALLTAEGGVAVDSPSLTSLNGGHPHRQRHGEHFAGPGQQYR